MRFPRVVRLAIPVGILLLVLSLFLGNVELAWSNIISSLGMNSSNSSLFEFMLPLLQPLSILFISLGLYELILVGLDTLFFYINENAVTALLSGAKSKSKQRIQLEDQNGNEIEQQKGLFNRIEMLNYVSMICGQDKENYTIRDEIDLYERHIRDNRPSLTERAHVRPEPLSDEFNADYLFKKSRKKTTALKTFLMDNAVVVGVGNIYANESLFLCGLHPLKLAANLTRNQCERLVDTIKSVLAKAIEQGGTTLKDFLQPDGRPGYFAQELLVYGNKGKPCPKCGTKIESLIIGQRNSFYCPMCQKKS